MRKIDLKIQYDGTNYYGWQKQKDKITISQCIEQAIFSTIHEKVTIFGSGRTDKGVHAICQHAHFECESDIEKNKLVLALNFYLPKDIRIIDAFDVGQDFDARKSVKKKTYMYKIYESKIENPLRKNEYCSKRILNVKKMQSSAKLLIGRHDFSSFCKFNNQKTTIRTIFSSEVKRTKDGIVILISANGFLYNMMRIIVYVLIKIGEGEKLDIEEIMNKKNRALINGLAPSQALYLYNVEY